MIRLSSWTQVYKGKFFPVAMIKHFLCQALQELENIEPLEQNTQ